MINISCDEARRKCNKKREEEEVILLLTCLFFGWLLSKARALKLKIMPRVDYIRNVCAAKNNYAINENN